MLVASGEYATLSVLLPFASEPAGTLMEAAPDASATAEEVYAPLVRVTVPVAAGAPVPPLTVTATVTDWLGVIWAADGVAVTVGVIFATVTLAVPLAEL